MSYFIFQRNGVDRVMEGLWTWFKKKTSWCKRWEIFSDLNVFFALFIFFIRFRSGIKRWCTYFAYCITQSRWNVRDNVKCLSTNTKYSYEHAQSRSTNIHVASGKDTLVAESFVPFMFEGMWSSKTEKFGTVNNKNEYG